ncbi:hypothetical protein BC936DRAFT_138494 [Jimgerdemannia flammicorona]|uniref:Tetratricopeptide repeat-domain-containing protein n=1 Tax=Jimgerdemannia flammicorona TaxID=994334 RepID=A0A433CC99_9FUNG|nr:hypothetical protein BC936DRAFT_138494 [Jimgerdemannia flammicorona]
MARLCEVQCKFDKAEPLYQRCLTISEKVSRSEHPSLFINQNYKGKYDEAETLYPRALTICEKVLGPAHPESESARNNLDNIHDILVRDGSPAQSIKQFVEMAH